MDLIESNVTLVQGDIGLAFQNTFKRQQTMSEFINIRRDMNSLIDEDEDIDDGKNVFGNMDSQASYSEKEVKDILFPRDNFKLFLEVR